MTGKLSRSLGEAFPADRLHWLILPLLSLIIALFLFPRILSKPQVYKPGDVAERDIKASRDLLIENTDLTEKNREKAVKEVLPVYDLESSASNLVARIREAFAHGRKYHERLRRLEEAEGAGEVTQGRSVQGPVEDLSQIKAQFFETLEIPPDDEIFVRFKKSGFPVEAEEAILRLTSQLFERGIVGDRTRPMEQIEKGGIILHEITSHKELRVTNPDRFFDPEGARRFIEGQRKTLTDTLKHAELAGAVIDLSQSYIQPNLTFNQRETESRKDMARNSVKPIYFKIKKGEMLVREGERIEEEHLLKLSEETLTHGTGGMMTQIPAMTILIGALLSSVYLVVLRGIKSFRGESRDLLFNSVTLLCLFFFAWAYNLVADEMARGFYFIPSSRTLLFAMPIAFGAMLISVFQGLTLAVTFSLVLSVLISLITSGRIEFFVYYFIGSLLAAYRVRYCTERGGLIKAGVKVGLANGAMAVAMEVLHSHASGAVSSLEVSTALISGVLGGILSGVIATGILPLIEMSFGFTTDIKLLELANLDQPLLRESMVQTPGTYHHSVIISNMVEATAKAINANPLLAKVSAYYHDIGKVKKPLYFIENQFDGINRHEKLAPSMSALILIAHVKDGVELAKKYRLGREITDIIQQHHGTNLISFFYQKAKERTEKMGDKSGEVEEEHFRYPGPKPQTKEAGLVMLADMVEASSRSMANPTSARIQGMVQKIIHNVFFDGQLDECELTLKDLHEIAKGFNMTLGGIFHQRVEYPEQVSKGEKKRVNGDTDQLPSEDARPKKFGDKTEIEEGLRRPGLS